MPARRRARRRSPTASRCSSRRTGTRRGAPGSRRRGTRRRRSPSSPSACAGTRVTGIVTPVSSQPAASSKQCRPSQRRQPKSRPRASGRRDVDLLPRALADVADPDRARLLVDAGAGTGCAGRSGGSRAGRRARPTNGLSSGIAYGSPAGRPGRRSAAACRASVAEVAGPVLGIAAAAAVAEADEQHPVGVEADPAAVVVGVRLGLGEDRPLDCRGRRRRQVVAGRSRNAAMTVVAVDARVVDEDLVAARAERRAGRPARAGPARRPASPGPRCRGTAPRAASRPPRSGSRRPARRRTGGPCRRRPASRTAAGRGRRRPARAPR